MTPRAGTMPLVEAAYREMGSAVDLEAIRVALRKAEIACLRAARNLADAQAVAVELIRATESYPHNAKGLTVCGGQAPDLRVQLEDISDDADSTRARGC